MKARLEAFCRQHQLLIGCCSSNKKQMVLMEPKQKPCPHAKFLKKEKILTRKIIQEENSCLTSIFPMFC